MNARSALSPAGQFTGSRIPDPSAGEPTRGAFAAPAGSVTTAEGAVTVMESADAPPSVFDDTPMWNPANIDDEIFGAPVYQQAHREATDRYDEAPLAVESLGEKATRAGLNVVSVVVFSVIGVIAAAIVVGYLAVTVGPWTVLSDGTVISRTVSDAPINALPAGTPAVATVSQPARSGMDSLLAPVQPDTVSIQINEVGTGALGEQADYTAACTDPACPANPMTVPMSHLVGAPDAVTTLPSWLVAPLAAISGQ